MQCSWTAQLTINFCPLLFNLQDVQPNSAKAEMEFLDTVLFSGLCEVYKLSYSYGTSNHIKTQKGSVRREA